MMKIILTLDLVILVSDFFFLFYQAVNFIELELQTWFLQVAA